VPVVLLTQMEAIAYLHPCCLTVDVRVDQQPLQIECRGLAVLVAVAVVKLSLQTMVSVFLFRVEMAVVAI
jgi:hypothetical protein